MRTIAAITLAALLVACGDDDDDDGNGGGGNEVTLTGTIAGRLTNGTSKILSGTCGTDFGDVGFAGALVAVSTAPDLCAAFTAGREPANSTSLLITFVNLNLTGGPASLGGTYTVWDGVGTPPLDLQGMKAAYAFISVARSGGPVAGQPECAVLGSGDATTGSVTITSATATAVAGTVTATFDDGTSATGSFSASGCDVPVTVDPTTCEVTGIPDTMSCG
jgi:hypothetical protein